jgi:hypothetical protein
MPEPDVIEHEFSHDLQHFLDQELIGLDDKYRVAIVLCDLQGKTRKAAARGLADAHHGDARECDAGVGANGR